jgi:hypothetical protein
MPAVRFSHHAGGVPGNTFLPSALGFIVATLATACSASSGSAELGSGATLGGYGGAGASGATGGVDPGVGGTGGGFIITVPQSGGGPGIDGGACGSVSINTSVEEVVTPGNVLIIFDQSDSMLETDFNGQARWLAASDAVVGAITPSKDALTVGAIFFPSAPGINLLVCDINSVAAINDTAAANPQIPFMPGTQFIDAWNQHWARNPFQLFTPIDAGLQRGDEALTGAGLQGQTVVVFATDGVPTCVTGTTSTDLPTKWNSQGIPTYVVGLPGAGQAGLQTIATAGGTNTVLLPTDGAQLQQQLSQVTSTIVKRSLNSCAIKFNQAPPDLSKVVLVVTDASNGAKYVVNQGPDGWSIAPDGSEATLQGATCSDATSGRFSTVSFAFGCVDAPVLR